METRHSHDHTRYFTHPRSGLTLGDIEELLERRGIPLSEVKGLRVVPSQRGDRDSPMWLEIKRYLTDEKGKRFAVRWPTNGNLTVAYETIRLPLVALWTADRPAIKVDPKVTYTDDQGVTRHRKASEILADPSVPRF